MPFHDVEQIMDSTAGAAYVEQELLMIFSETFGEIVEGFDIRDKAPRIVNSQGANMDAVARDKAKVFGEPQYTSKVGNVKQNVSEEKTRETYPIHEMTLAAKFSRRELRQAAATNRPLQADRLRAVREAIELKSRNDFLKGFAGLGLPGFLSDAGKLMDDQAGSAISGLSDVDLEDLFISMMTTIEDEYGMDFPVTHIWMAPAIHARFNRSKGTDGSGPSMKSYLADTYNIPMMNWFSDQRLKEVSVGSYTNKDAMIFLPAHPRILEVLNPLRLVFDEPYKDGSDLVIEGYAQLGGVAIYELLPVLFDA